jgi:hypothetical protein
MWVSGSGLGSNRPGSWGPAAAGAGGGGRPALRRGWTDVQDLERPEGVLEDLERGGQLGVEARVAHCSASSLACFEQWPNGWPGSLLRPQ